MKSEKCKEQSEAQNAERRAQSVLAVDHRSTFNGSAIVRSGHRAGYSLLEVLLALTVLVIGVTALTSLIDRAQSDVQTAAELSAAQIACQTLFDEMLGGIRPIAPVANEPVPNLPNWFFSVVLQPANRNGLTSVRAAVDKERTSNAGVRRAGADHFELVCWVNTDRIPQNVRNGAAGFNDMGGIGDLSGLAIGSSGLPTAGDLATFRPAPGNMTDQTSGTVPPLQIPLDDLMPQASQSTSQSAQSSQTTSSQNRRGTRTSGNRTSANRRQNASSAPASPSDNPPDSTPDTSGTTTPPDSATSQNSSGVQNGVQNDVTSQNNPGEAPPLAIPDENDVSNTTGVPNRPSGRSGP